MSEVIRKNLRSVIASSGLTIKEIAYKTEKEMYYPVKKETIDNWIGKKQTTPRADDLWAVCMVLQTTMEFVCSGIDPRVEWATERPLIEQGRKYRELLRDFDLLDDAAKAVYTTAIHNAAEIVRERQAREATKDERETVKRLTAEEKMAENNRAKLHVERKGSSHEKTS